MPKSYKFYKARIIYYMRFLCIKKKTIVALLCAMIILASVVSVTVITTSSMPKPEYSIVIDAGHGGRDGGAVGVNTGVTESELNLMYAKELEKLCEEFGIGVTMTRSDMNGLYDESAPNKKKSEMERRKNIINSSGADLMVSLHMNSFPLPSGKGAQVFYASGSEQGFDLAKSVQTSICQNFDSARNYVSVGDYFVLNYSEMPAVLVECGFLSNPEEENLLQTEEYCEKFCYSILAGILGYFEM